MTRLSCRPSGWPARLTARKACSLVLQCLVLTLALAALGGCASTVPVSDGDSHEAAGIGYQQAMRMAETVRANGDIAGAAVFFRRAHRLSPDNPQPVIGLADAAAAAGASANAAEMYRKAVTLAPDNAAARLGLGRTLLALGRADSARAELRAALDADSDNPQAYVALGVAHELSGDPVAAQGIYAEGLRHRPENVPLRNNLALSLALAGRTQDAVEMLRTLAEQPAADARVRQNLALALALAGRLDAAEAVAAQDLRGGALLSNLSFFRSLRRLNGPDLAAAVMCRCIRGAADRASVQDDPAPPPFPDPAASDPAASDPAEATSPAATLARSTPAGHKRSVRPRPAARETAQLSPPRTTEIVSGSKTLVVLDEASLNTTAAPREAAVGATPAAAPAATIAP